MSEIEPKEKTNKTATGATEGLLVCPNCSATLDIQGRFCPYCGAKLEQHENKQSQSGGDSDSKASASTVEMKADKPMPIGGGGRYTILDKLGRDDGPVGEA